MNTAFRLVIKSGSNAGMTFPLEDQEVTVGRDTTNQITIIDPEVSRRHARIYLQGANYIIEDLGSTNGTSVNGQRLVGPYILRPGEMVTLGENMHLLFEEVVVDPDATVASAKPVAMAAPKPVATEGPRSTAFQSPVTPPESFSGYVPSQPVSQPPARKKKLSTWVIILIIVVVLLACGCIGFFIFDALDLYCEFPGIMNMLIPGACPP